MKNFALYFNQNELEMNSFTLVFHQKYMSHGYPSCFFSKIRCLNDKKTPLEILIQPESDNFYHLQAKIDVLTPKWFIKPWIKNNHF